METRKSCFIHTEELPVPGTRGIQEEWCTGGRGCPTPDPSPGPVHLSHLRKFLSYVLLQPVTY